MCIYIISYLIWMLQNIRHLHTVGHWVQHVSNSSRSQIPRLSQIYQCSADSADWLTFLWTLMVWFCWNEFSSEHTQGYNIRKCVKTVTIRRNINAAMRLTSRLILRGQVSRKTAETGLMDMVNDDQWWSMMINDVCEWIRITTGCFCSGSSAGSESTDAGRQSPPLA